MIAPRVGVREWLGETLDRLVLAMAVAGAQDDLAMLDPRYAEGMVLVFDAYFNRESAKRTTVGQPDASREVAPH